MNDSLILKIEEFDCETQMNTNTIFVLYDKYNFILRGEKTKHSTVPYSFECSKVKSLAEFILMTSNHELQYSMYVHPDLPLESNDITYDYLSENLTEYHEISGNYKPDLLTALSIVKNVFNSY
jgi:hypothetical protein